MGMEGGKRCFSNLYICGIPSGILLSTKIPGFADPLNTFGIDLEVYDATFDETIQGFYDDADLAYYEKTNNPAKSEDLEFFLDGWATAGLMATSSDLTD